MSARSDADKPDAAAAAPLSDQDLDSSVRKVAVEAVGTARLCSPLIAPRRYRKLQLIRRVQRASLRFNKDHSRQGKQQHSQRQPHTR